MDTTQILIKAFSPLVSDYWWLIFLFIFVLFLKSPFMKGVLGEFLVNLAAKFFLDKNIYQLFKNVTLPTEDGTTQIDHVIVSRYGVFVIETKNMKGWIFGSPQQKNWTQKIYRQKKRGQVLQ
jgi:restriction system protein